MLQIAVVICAWVIGGDERCREFAIPVKTYDEELCQQQGEVVEQMVRRRFLTMRLNGTIEWKCEPFNTMVSCDVEKARELQYA